MYTSHGHYIPGTDIDIGKRPSRARCGGISHCITCAKEVGQLTKISDHQVEFQEELRRLIGKYDLEVPSGTPDYILAAYIVKTLKEFNKVVFMRDQWQIEHPGELPNNNNMKED